MTIRYRQIIVAIILNFLIGPIFAQYDVRNSGAKGDGMTLDTRAFQSAVDMAFENGGGTVTFHDPCRLGRSNLPILFGRSGKGGQFLD